jgi:hypothetical protein
LFEKHTTVVSFIIYIIDIVRINTRDMFNVAALASLKPTSPGRRGNAEEDLNNVNPPLDAGQR